MPMPLYQMKQLLIDACHRVYAKGWVASNDGNLSARLDDGRILCTPTGMSKGVLTPEDLCIIDLDGNTLEAAKGRRPSSEMKVHLMAYKERQDVMSVCHAHPPYATGYALAGMDLGECKLPEVILSLGTVPLTSYGLPGTDELPDKIKEWIHQSDAFLMELHGVLTVGQDIMNCFYKMETVEHFAHIDFVARNLGGAQTMSKERAEELLAARGRYGVTTPNIGCRALDGYAAPPPASEGTAQSSRPNPAALQQAAAPAQLPAEQEHSTMSSDQLVEEVTKRVIQALKNL